MQDFSSSKVAYVDLLQSRGAAQHVHVCCALWLYAPSLWLIAYIWASEKDCLEWRWIFQSLSVLYSPK